MENDTPGLKFDKDKPRYDLVPLEALESMVNVLTFGAQKYAPENWRHVELAQDRYFAATLRHLIAVRKGEVLDKESGLPHLAHAMCCVAFMLELSLDESK